MNDYTKIKNILRLIGGYLGIVKSQHVFYSLRVVVGDKESIHELGDTKPVTRHYFSLRKHKEVLKKVKGEMVVDLESTWTGFWTGVSFHTIDRTNIQLRREKAELTIASDIVALWDQYLSQCPQKGVRNFSAGGHSIVVKSVPDPQARDYVIYFIFFGEEAEVFWGNINQYEKVQEKREKNDRNKKHLNGAKPY